MRAFRRSSPLPVLRLHDCHHVGTDLLCAAENGRGPGGLAPVQRLHGVGPAPSGSRNTWKSSTCIGCSRVSDATNMASSGALSEMVFLGLEDDVLGGDKPTSDGRCDDLTAYDQSPVGAIAPCLTPSRQLRRVSLPNPCTRSPADLDQAAINRFWSAPWATCRVRCGSGNDLPVTKRTVDLRRILADRRDRLRWPAPPNGR